MGNYMKQPDRMYHWRECWILIAANHHCRDGTWFDSYYIIYAFASVCHDKCVASRREIKLALPMLHVMSYVQKINKN